MKCRSGIQNPFLDNSKVYMLIANQGPKVWSGEARTHVAGSPILPIVIGAISYASRNLW